MIPQLGIAVATALGGWLNAYLLWVTLTRRRDFLPDARIKRNAPLTVLASFAMAGALVVTSRVLAPYYVSSGGFLFRGSMLTVEIGVGLAVYGALILATGVMTIGQLRRLMRGEL
jgi:putative peptidoglycan lipid II flippase